MRSLPIIAFIFAAIPLVATAEWRPRKWPVGQTVRTTSGPVDGHAASVASEVSEYLGIPYAQPPVDKLRFQPPVRYHGSKRIDGKSFGYACMPSNISAYDADFPQELIEKYGITDVGKKLLTSVMNPGIPVSEDCLTLNIWTKPQTGERRKAVMVWIHGGSFVSGSSAVPDYNGKFFADQEDVVLVSINYRITIFGFPGNPLGAQNLGLLDQRLAVEWIRDNIASFGGDPSRITLFGESAGGASVDDYSYAWPSDPIVHALIPMSGTTRGIGVRTPEVATALWFNASSALNCGNTTTPAAQVQSCMQSVPASALTAALVNAISSRETNSVPYSPTIDNTLVFPANSTTTRRAARIPMLIGNTDNESGLFRVFVPGPDSDALWQSENQRVFNCPAAARAAESVRDGNPTWRYRWHGVFPNTELSTTPKSGAYHGSEVPVLFGTVDERLVGNTKEEVSVGRYMRGVWATFAKDPKRGLLREYGWPRYGGEGKTLARIGWEGRTGRNPVVGGLYDEGC